MTNKTVYANPFKVFTPEDMEASEVHALFVHPFTDFNKIRDVGHTMVHGPRGCGKSMIFRYLLPDCQCLALGKELRYLPFLAFLISIKNTVPNLTELRRLENRHADVILSEHVLTIFSLVKVFQALATLKIEDSENARIEALEYFERIFLARLEACGGNMEADPEQCRTAQAVFALMMRGCDQIYAEVVQYARRLAFMGEEILPYGAALCGYTDFLFPVLTGLRNLSFLPNGPVYLLMDDADYLSHPQTLVLNSWVSTRTQGEVSIKASTQLRYRTFETAGGLPIQSPHDYQAINIADIYTTRSGRYLSRVEEIVKKRLMAVGIEVMPREFFPADQGQEKRIGAVREQLRANWKEEGRGFRPSDDVVRYATPEYIKRLGGPSKSRNTYSYSGFEQLVHISSGLVRYFLEAAAVMFDEQSSGKIGEEVLRISPAIQNRVVRDEADRLMLTEFERIKKEGDAGQAQIVQLANLLKWLGGTFFLKLISQDAERRVFSVAISGKLAEEVEEVFELGVRHSYFHRSSIGNKEGTGRTRLYVLTRRLAPHFNLDPSSFAGYLWTTSEVLMRAMEDPDRSLGRMERRGVGAELETGQLSLFER